MTDTLLENLEEVAPGPAQEILTNAIRNLQGAGGASGVAFVIGLATAIWASSGYVSGFMDASNAVYDVEEGRGLTKKLPVRVGLTIVLMILAGLIAFSVTSPAVWRGSWATFSASARPRSTSGAWPSGRCCCCS